MRAVTVELEHTVDLDDVCRGDGLLFVRNGVGVAGRDVVARFDSAPSFDAVDGSPIAFATLPFEPTAAPTLLLARLTVTRDADGRCTLTVIDGDVDAAVEELAAPVGPPRPAAFGFTVRPKSSVPHYLEAVRAARDAVRAGDIDKAVIARAVEVVGDEPIDVHAVLLRLRASFGSSYRYCVDGLIGASPELLVEVAGTEVRSHPLAGTAPRTGDPETDRRSAEQLVASTKNQVEHRVVIDTIYDTLLPYCSYLDWEAEPSVLSVANVQHLATRMEGRLSEPRPPAIELARELAPTPALGGAPRDAALALIARVEDFRRGRYGGAVGWLDAAGNGTFAVTIRCAELSADRRTARLVAGGGIVADSDPDAELAETQAKLQAMLSAIVRS